MTTILILLGAATVTRWVMRGILWLDGEDAR